MSSATPLFKKNLQISKSKRKQKTAYGQINVLKMVDMFRFQNYWISTLSSCSFITFDRNKYSSLKHKPFSLNYFQVELKTFWKSYWSIYVCNNSKFSFLSSFILTIKSANKLDAYLTMSSVMVTYLKKTCTMNNIKTYPAYT